MPCAVLSNSEQLPAAFSDFLLVHHDKTTEWRYARRVCNEEGINGHHGQDIPGILLHDLSPTDHSELTTSLPTAKATFRARVCAGNCERSWKCEGAVFTREEDRNHVERAAYLHEHQILRLLGNAILQSCTFPNPALCSKASPSSELACIHRQGFSG